ncbi:anti-sigma factor [Nocardia sp. NPDC059240]|uniref:anti-sigma factor n=1 Tax=Nocardia sp. NPDC059240 TaxID=3346786 RepID=UPI00367D6B31
MTAGVGPDVELLDLAYPYALDAVTEWERRGIERRREHADRLTAAEFDGAVAALYDTLAELSAADICTPPKTLETRLMRAVDRAIRAAERHTLERHGGRTRHVPRLERLAAAVVLVAVAIGVGVLVGTHRPGAPEPLPLTAGLIATQPDAVTRSAPIIGGGTVRIEAAPKLSAMTVAFDGLAAPPPDRAYQVWLVANGGEPRSAAILDAVPGQPLITPFGAADRLVVTVEPAGGSRQPTTVPIASIELR